MKGVIFGGKREKKFLILKTKSLRLDGPSEGLLSFPSGPTLSVNFDAEVPPALSPSRGKQGTPYISLSRLASPGARDEYEDGPG